MNFKNLDKKTLRNACICGSLIGGLAAAEALTGHKLGGEMGYEQGIFLAKNVYTSIDPEPFIGFCKGVGEAVGYGGGFFLGLAEGLVGYKTVEFTYKKLKGKFSKID